MPLSQRCNSFSRRIIEKKKVKETIIIKKKTNVNKISKGAKDEYEELKKKAKNMWRI